MKRKIASISLILAVRLILIFLYKSEYIINKKTYQIKCREYIITTVSCDTKYNTITRNNIQ